MLIYYLLILMIPFSQYPPFFRIIPGFSLIKIVGAATFGYAIFYLLTQDVRSKFKPFESKEAKLFFAFVVFVLFSGAAHYSEVTGEYVQRYLLYLVFFFTTYILVDSSKKLERVYFLIIVSMLLACYRGFKEYFIYKGVYEHFRPESVIGDPNYFALSLLFALPFSYYIWNHYRSKWVKFFGLFSSIVFLIMIFITMSRGAVIGLIMIFTMIIIYSKRRLKSFIIVGLCISFLIPIVPPKVWDRFSSITELVEIISLDQRELTPHKEGSVYGGDEISLQKRYHLLIAGIRMTLDNWVTGVGIGNFRSYLQSHFPETLSEAQIAHNMYIELSAELGIIGITLFFLMIVFTFKSISRIGKIAEENGITKFKYFVNALKIGLIGFFTGAIFLTSQYEKIFWFGIFLVTSLWRIMKTEYPEIIPDKKSTVQLV